MNSDEVCHLRIHLLSVKELERQIFGTAPTCRARRLIHHIVKIHFTLADTSRRHTVLVIYGWSLIVRRVITVI